MAGFDVHESLLGKRNRAFLYSSGMTLLLIIVLSLSTVYLANFASRDERNFKREDSYSKNTKSDKNKPSGPFLNTPKPLFSGSWPDISHSKPHHVDKPTLLKRISDELNKLPTGHIMFNPPKEMIDGKTERIEVRIGQTFTARMMENLKGRGKPQIEKVQITPYMTVSLKGEKFGIESLNSESQLISGDYTEWAWNVTPKETGTQSLFLIVSVTVKLRNDGEKIKDLPTLERQIDVKVSPVEASKKLLKFLNDYWAVLAGIFAGIIWISRWVYKKQKEKANNAVSP